jgi:D-glycero-alpha-D-manno-heptose 1-phosphate guanylyltransferase
MTGKTTAVILAGGLGTRLRKVVPDIPKPLAEIGGRPFIEHLLDMLADYAIKDAVICTGHLAELIEERLGAGYRGIEITYSKEARPLGTGGALRLALPIIKKSRALVLNGDSYCPADIKKFYEFHNKKNADISMVLAKADSSSASGVVETDDNGRVVSFREKKEEKAPCMVNAGIYLLERALIRKIPPGAQISLEKEIFPLWTDIKFFGFPCGAGLIDIGTPDGYKRARERGLA